MALHLLSLEEVRTACRQRLDACELWLRRLVHDQLVPELGEDYLVGATFNGQSLLPKGALTRIASRIASQPKRYPRPVDAMLLDDLVSLFGKDDLYRKFFATPMKAEFPAGREHVRSTLKTLVPIRNALSHANPISTHDAERVFCYCSDLIETIAHHYRSIGMTQDFDAPSFTRFSDSLGNVIQPVATKQILPLTGNELRPGMTLRCEVEVDSHYLPADYTVHWNVTSKGGEDETGSSLCVTLQSKHVAETLFIEARVVSKKDWHRHGHFDAEFTAQYRVLPPI